MKKLGTKPEPCKCGFCGISEDIHLLDGVLHNGQDAGKLACIACYPTSGSTSEDGDVLTWSALSEAHLQLSIAPKLRQMYDAYFQSWNR